MLPISFDAQRCAGEEEDTFENWQLVDGGQDESTLYNELLAGYTAEDKENTVAAAAADKAWNAVTSHTTYDIILARLPQLRKRCKAEYCILSKSGFVKFGSTRTFASEVFATEKFKKIGGLYEEGDAFAALLA